MTANTRSGSDASSDNATTTRLEIEQIRAGKRTALEDAVVVEETLSIVVNGRLLVRLQYLPGAEEDLAVGFLLTNGLIRTAEQLARVQFAADRRQVDIEARLEAGVMDAFETGASVGSGCGVGVFAPSQGDPLDCGRKFDMSFGVDATVIQNLMREFRDRSELFARTGGVHAAGLACGERLAAFAEDIGRHNAIDKVIGHAFRRGHELGHGVLLTSGRLSLEIVLKAVQSGIPLLVSRSAPTAQAVQVARRCHLGLVGFARGDRMNLYAAGWRVRTDPTQPSTGSEAD